MKLNYKYIILGTIILIAVFVIGYYISLLKHESERDDLQALEKFNFQIITEGNKTKHRTHHYNFSFTLPISFMPSFGIKKYDMEEMGVFTSDQFIYKRNNKDEVPFTISLAVKKFEATDKNTFLETLKALARDLCKERSTIVNGIRKPLSPEYCEQNTIFRDYITKEGFLWYRAALKSGTWGFDFDVLSLSFPLRNGASPSEVTGIVVLIPHFDYAIPVENNSLESKIISFSKNFEYNFTLPNPPTNEFWDRSAGYSITLPEKYIFEPYPSALGGIIHHSPISYIRERVAYIDWQQVETYTTEENLEKNVLLSCSAGGPSGSQYCDKIISKEKIFGKNIEGYKFFVRQIYEYYDDITNTEKKTETIEGPMVVFILPDKKTGLVFKLHDGENNAHKEIFEQIYTSFRYLSDFERTGLQQLIELPKESIEGIGVSFGTDFKIEYVIADSPADKVGLSVGDKILKINDINVPTLTQKQAIDYIKGPKGTTVKLTILKRGQIVPVDIDITRDVIIIP